MRDHFDVEVEDARCGYCSPAGCFLDSLDSCPGSVSGMVLVHLSHFYNHTHEHIGTVGIATKHSKTPVNHLMMNMQRPSQVLSRLKRVLVVREEVEQSDSSSVLLLLLVFFFFFSLFSESLCPVSLPVGAVPGCAGTSILSSSALQNGFQIRFSLCCDQAIKTPGGRRNGLELARG